MPFTYAGLTFDGRTLEDRIDRTETCWLWTGTKTLGGYGQVSKRVAGKRKKFYVHRVAYEQTRCAIPAGMVIDHLCRVRNCVNPDHMEVVTLAENTLRGDAPQAINARKTAAPCGHPYDWVEKSGTRRCYACSRADARERSRRWQQQRKVA